MRREPSVGRRAIKVAEAPVRSRKRGRAEQEAAQRRRRELKAARKPEKPPKKAKRQKQLATSEAGPSCETSNLPASQPPVMVATLPLLVLLDLNGVLVHRPPSNSKQFTVRPGTLTLLSSLYRRVEIGFCSSMQPKNARAAIRAIEAAARVAGTESLGDLLRSSVLFAGDAFHFRNDCGVPLLPLRVPTLEPWRKLRNLANVWRTKAARGHAEQSTILCDDTPGKCPLSPRNVLLVPTWDGEAGGAAELSRLAQKLLGAADAQSEGADVRCWLDAHAPAEATVKSTHIFF